MKMTMTKTLIASAGVTLCLLTLTAAAPAKTVSAKKTAPAKKTAATAAMYECTKCHMKVNAATAKKDHYKDPMDGGTFAAVKTAKK